MRSISIIQIFFLIIGLHMILASSSTTSIPKDQHLRKTSKADDTTSDDISREKKKNIPLVPKPNEGVTGLTSLKYSGGKHPVLHEFVSDHPATAEVVGTKKDTVVQPPATNYVDPYASIIPPMTESGGVEDPTPGVVSHKPSKRFELYPKWFSNKVPSIFGKRFSKSYYYPFDGSSGGAVKSRNTIAPSPHGRRMRVAAVGSRMRAAHSLPMSYMQQAVPASIHIQAGGGIGMGLSQRRLHGGAVAMMPIGVPAELYGSANPDVAASPYAGNVIGGGVYGPNQFSAAGLGAPIGVMDLSNDMGYSGPAGVVGDYPMRQVPHGLMQRMNSDMYQPMSG